MYSYQFNATLRTTVGIMFGIIIISYFGKKIYKANTKEEKVISWLSTTHPLPTIMQNHEAHIQINHNVVKTVGYHVTKEDFIKFVTMNSTICNKSVRVGRVFDGGWDVCMDPSYVLEQPCLVYSFGINNEWSFDNGISKKYGCNVMAFDPSMKRGIYKHSDLVWFYPLGIGDKDKFDEKGLHVQTLASILEFLNHSSVTIDILKMDVENGEWSSFSTIFKDNALLKVKQLMFEIHICEKLWDMYYSTLKKLEDIGFRKWHFHHNPSCVCCWELYYVNVKFSK